MSGSNDNNSDWKEVTDSKSGRVYYYNKKTKGNYIIIRNPTLNLSMIIINITRNNVE